MKTLITSILFLFYNLSLAQISKTINYKTLTLNFVSNKLVSPGSAKLVEYDGTSETMKILTNAQFHLNACYKVTRAIVDSQNSFGALIRGTYLVFFLNDEPCVLVTADKIIEFANEDEQTRNAMLKTELIRQGCSCK